MTPGTMGLVVIGTPDDVVGFGLAGLSGTVCETSAQAVAALRAASQDHGVGLIVVSPSVAALAADTVRSCQAASGLPLVIVLPEAAPKRSSGESS